MSDLPVAWAVLIGTASAVATLTVFGLKLGIENHRRRLRARRILWALGVMACRALEARAESWRAENLDLALRASIDIADEPGVVELLLEIDRYQLWSSTADPDVGMSDERRRRVSAGITEALSRLKSEPANSGGAGLIQRLLSPGD